MFMLVHWPIYPRLRRTMQRSEWERNSDPRKQAIARASHGPQGLSVRGGALASGAFFKCRLNQGDKLDFHPCALIQLRNAAGGLGRTVLREVSTIDFIDAAQFVKFRQIQSRRNNLLK